MEAVLNLGMMVEMGMSSFTGRIIRRMTLPGHRVKPIDDSNYLDPPA